MAETKLTTNKYDIMQASRNTKPQIVFGAPSPSAEATSFPSDPLKTIWDISLDEITATVLSELRL